MNAGAPRVRKSRRIPLGLVVFVASSLAACGPTDHRRCVDKDGRVVEDRPCERGPAGAAYGGVVGAYARGPYRWYYGGRGVGVGDVVSGGSYTPRPGVSYHSSTVRGGFGHSAVAHGSGGHA